MSTTPSGPSEDPYRLDRRARAGEPLKRDGVQRFSRWVVCVLLLSLLAACSPATPASSPTATSGAPSLGTPAAISTAPISLTPLPADTLAILRRTGGIAGGTQESTLKRDGSVVTGAVVKQAVGGAAAATALVDKLTTTGIYTLSPGKYFPVVTCCDRRTFELMLSKDNKTYSYATLEGSDLTPPPLRDTLNLIQTYIDAAR